MKVMIMAGGTGGHVYPALAVAQVLRDGGHEVVWMGTPGSFESRVVPEHGYPMEFIRIGGLRGKGLLTLLLAPLVIARAMLDAWAVLRRCNPAAVLGMGGYAAGPGGLVAWLWDVPLLLHESNAAAGMTNRVLARIANRVLQAFPNTFPNGETVGNPVRKAIAEIAPPAERYAARSGAVKLLIIGGSQGSRALNVLIPEALSVLAPAVRPTVRHQAGRTIAVARKVYARTGVDASVVEFIDDMAEAFAWADLVICRSGASTVAELAAAGCASILVPFPAAVDDHQTKNAMFLVEAGAARLYPEAEITASGLAATLREMSDRQILVDMAQRARKCAWQDTEQRVAAAIVETAEARANRGRGQP